MKLHKRVSLLLSMGIMAIGLITFKFSPAIAQNTDSGQVDVTVENTPTPTPTPTSTPTPTPTPTPIPNDLKKLDENSDIHQLIVKYLEAKLTCDREQFNEIVSNPEYIDEEALQQKYETVLDFSDITCYAKRGIGVIDYIVYYTYYYDIATISTKAISIDRAFIYHDEENNYRIYIGEVDSATEEYVKLINYDDDVQKLINESYAVMAEEIQQDENLLNYLMRAYPELDFGVTGQDSSESTEGETGESTEGSEGSTGEGSEGSAGEGSESTATPTPTDAPAGSEPHTGAQG